ncbi:hypothetical protein [uncultured Tateyamaria sp.]|uniref:hypothetical protein n=1 Tax=uncultured Tateyamaria sp. TaxID=455651 RepID=UPI00261FC7B3|nr:hypothetical protein [uncultured Tateyamaria sp.]
MKLIARYQMAILTRRAVSLPSSRTLAQAGFDASYGSQISGGRLDPSLVRANAAHPKRAHYLHHMPYNKVIDKVLALLGLTRTNICVTPIFNRLMPERSSIIPPYHARARRPFDINHVTALYLSAHTTSYDKRPHQIANAMEAA